MTPAKAYEKAYSVSKRLPKLEQIVLTSPSYAYLYALDVIKGRWIEAEDVIMNHSLESCCYAKGVIKGKLPEKMHNMMILHVIKKSDDIWAKEYFEYIKMTPSEALIVALKTGRSTSEIEDAIMTSPFEGFYYAQQVVKGKLPEKMHNMMILHAIKEPSNSYVKAYFTALESLEFPNFIWTRD